METKQVSKKKRKDKITPQQSFLAKFNKELNKIDKEQREAIIQEAGKFPNLLKRNRER